MSLIWMELTELIERAVRVVDGSQGVHPAVDILADDQIRRMRLGIFDADRLVAGLLDRLLEFRREGHCHLRAPIVSAHSRSNQGNWLVR
jgi:hypothetical protein